MTMEIHKNVLPEELCDTIFELAKTVATTPGGVKIRTPENPDGEALECWMNYGWEKSLIKDSTPVFCIKLPKFLATQIQEELQKINIYNPQTHKSFEENNWIGCMAYVWTYNSYISLHHDSERKTATIYLNRTWSYEEGGHFNWYDENSKEWKIVVPEFNTMIVNNGGIPHATTPVKSNSQFRISLQIFFIPR